MTEALAGLHAGSVRRSRTFFHRALTRPLAYVRHPALVVGVITAVGALLRFYHLGSKPLWYDEAVMWLIQYGEASAGILANNATANSSPPLFAYVLRAVTLLGSSEAALRLVPAVASVLCIPAIYFLSASLTARPLTSYVAAGLMAIAPTQVVYAQQVREYSIVVLLTCLVYALHVRNMKEPTRTRSLLLAAVEVVSVLTHYGLLLVVASAELVAQVALLWRARGERERGLVAAVRRLSLGRLTLVGLVTAGVYVVSYRWQAQAGGFGGNGYLQEGYWLSGSLTQLVDLLLIRNSIRLLNFALPVRDGLLVAALIIVAGGVSLFRVRAGVFALSLLLSAFVLTIGLAVGRLYPYYPGRQDIFLTVALYLLLAWGIGLFLEQSRANRPLTVLVAAVAVNVCVIPALRDTWTYARQPGHQQINLVSPTLRAAAAADDGVFVSYNAIPGFLYYWCRDGACDPALLEVGRRRLRREEYGDQVDRSVVLSAPPPGTGLAEQMALRGLFRPAQVADLLGRRDRVWLLFSLTSAGDRTAVLDLAARRGRVEERFAEGPELGVWLYEFRRTA